MKIGIDARTTSILGGAGVYVDNLLKSLSKVNLHDDEVLVLSPTKAKNNLRSNQFSHLEVKTENPLLWNQIYLPKIISYSKLNIYHGTKNTLPLYQNKNTKYIVTVLDLMMLKFPQMFSLMDKIYWRIFLSHAIRTADRIITISDSTKRDILDMFRVDENKIKTIHLGVDTKFFKPLGSEKVANYKKVKKLPKHFILYIGNKRPNKNLERSFRAYENLVMKDRLFPPLVVVGKDSYKSFKIYSSIKTLKCHEKIILLNAVKNKELPLLYNAADLFIYPSLYEGFGLPILEAMACGTPVTTSNISSMPEVAGNAALTFDPHREEEIATAILKVLEDDQLRKQLIKKGLERVKTFSWEKCVRQTLEVYHDLNNEKD